MKARGWRLCAAVVEAARRLAGTALARLDSPAPPVALSPAGGRATPSSRRQPTPLGRPPAQAPEQPTGQAQGKAPEQPTEQPTGSGPEPGSGQGRGPAQMQAAALTREQLLERQRFVDGLLETIEVGIVACDADANFMVTNRAERALFGLDQSLDGREIDYLEPRIDVYEDGRRLDPDEYPLMRALRGEDVGHIEVVGGPSGGPYRDLVVRGRQITGDDGRVLGAVAALSDVTAERAAVRQLAEEHRRLAEAQRLGRLGSFEHDFPTGNWTFSDHLAVLWGLEPAAVTPEAIFSLVDEADRRMIATAWAGACTGGGARHYDLHIRRADDGAARLIRVALEVTFDAEGRLAQARGSHLDITDLAAAEAAAQQANAFLHAILTASPDCTFVADVDRGAILYVSPGKDVLGLERERLTELGIDGLVALTSPEDRAEACGAIDAALALPDGEVTQAQCRARHTDGSWRWLSQRVTPFRRDDSGRVVEVLVVARDVTDVVDAQERLAHAARHDHLTGLPNRAMLVERVESALRRARRDGREIAVLFCDLDGFKHVNDLGGHATGDAVLSEIARRLVAVVRDGDVVARMGGDEFVVVVEPWNRSVAGLSATAGEQGVPRPSPLQPSLLQAAPVDLPGRELARQVAQRVVAALREPVVVGDASFAVTASVGIAYAGRGDGAGGEAAVSGDDILHRADLAMYRAKQQGKDHIEVFDLQAGLPAARPPARVAPPLS